jgi:hypothetical protein
MTDTVLRTRVELLHLEGKIERWIRFGHVADEEILDRRRRAFWFRPDSVFAFIRWAAGDHGTLVSRIDILRACGWAKVERVLQLIDQVEALGVQPADACPDHWRHIHNRLAAAEEPRPYSVRRHAAWLSRRSLNR